MSKHIPSINNDELRALVLHDPARTEEPYSRRSQIARAVLIPNHGHWVGFYDPNDIDRQPLYVRAKVNGTGGDGNLTISMWDKCQVSINKRKWHSVGNRHGLGKFMMQWYEGEVK
jgi:hypothetical protein